MKTFEVAFDFKFIPAFRLPQNFSSSSLSQLANPAIYLSL